ncbi:hypothetical protein KC842_00860 [Candidatus Nomurabacteria bacterium]|nr:hypothetical protein [Candidatus Nomurabacteria bacterium]
MIRLRKVSKKYSKREIYPDEIFLDSSNLPSFNVQQFEGTIEKPISKTTVRVFSFIIFFVFVGITARLASLQIFAGAKYYDQSVRNSLDKEILFSERGVIYDRNGVELAWNEKKEEGEIVPKRSYIDGGGFSHILGYVSYPKLDSSGNYWQEDFIGKSGVEAEYNDLLSGENGERLIERDVFGNIYSENSIKSSIAGENLYLTIDSVLQSAFYDSIKNHSEEYGYVGGAGVIMSIKSGGVLAMTSYPEFDSEIMSLGEDKETINSYQNDKSKPFLLRSLSGLYTPGSIVKPFVAIGALEEGVIDEEKQIYSSGSISLVSPYDPDVVYTYKDNKAHGWVDMRRALTVSSNVYFYEISGGFENQKGLGISGIEKYTRMFGIGEKTGIDLSGEKDGIIPNPDWKKKVFNGDIWRVGDTYNTAIGQYGFQVTPIQMVRAIAAIANGGTLVTPHVTITSDEELVSKEPLPIDPEHFDVVREGIRGVVLEGTGIALSYLPIDIAAKTGTAQVGLAKQRVNSWVVGFFPYDDPQYAFAVIMENGPLDQPGATWVMQKTLSKVDTFDFLIEDE